MCVKPENATPGQLVPRCVHQARRQLVHVAGRAQRIRRRLAAADLLADGFLKIDDRAGFVHGGKLARRLWRGERLFPHATSAFNLRQTSSTFARELKAEMRK